MVTIGDSDAREVRVYTYYLNSVVYISASSTNSACDVIYRGFADCLISLGDNMAKKVQKVKGNEDLDNSQELEFICKSWDEFHKCANNVLVNCPEDAAAIWESLRQESRKIQYQGNLHDLCAYKNQQINVIGASDTGETNKETLRGSAYISKYSLLLFVVLFIVLQWIIA
ncbi:neuritin-like protein [Gastrophryne carolinensis]